jgi:hypothetical protein
MSTVDAILERWPLGTMLARLSISVPQKGKFRSPFRPDNNPSCEILGEKIRDWTTGQNFDAIGCFAEAKGLSNSDAIRALAAELPGRQPKPSAPSKPEGLKLPALRYSPEEAAAVAKSRGLGVESVEMAGAIYGTLSFGLVGSFNCWVLSDENLKLAEARRMSGKPFPAVGSLSERKSHTLKGSCKAWPLGTKIKVSVPGGLTVVLVEGGPDYLAACELAVHAKREFLPVAMLGASQSIHAAALPFFKGRDVLILAHPDEAGRAAAIRWAAQLKQAGATPRANQLTGGDLNDLVASYGGPRTAELFDL